MLQESFIFSKQIKKIELANQPLPNTKKNWLFGEEFPSRSRFSLGISQEFGAKSSKTYYTKPGTRINSQPNYDKYQNFRGRNKFFQSRHGLPWQNYISNNGKQVTSDPEVLAIVVGFSIPFRQNPYQIFQPITLTPQGLEPIFYQKIQSLLAKGAIMQIPLSKDGYYSRIFFVSKKDGGMHTVIEQFVENQHFQMENLTSVKTLLKQGDFMTNLDLKDAYLRVAINPQSQKFLCFNWKGKAYQFKALPFGLNIAPLVFTKLLKPVAAFLRKQGICLILYLDDMLIKGSSAQEAMQFTQIAINLLSSLGFTVHKEKSMTTPTQIITFLGFTINSITRQVSLPPDKVTTTSTLCCQILKADIVPLQLLARLLGVLESHHLVIWKAPLHFRHLQAQLIQDLQNHNHQYNVCIHLPQASKTELAWWLMNLQQVNGSQIVAPTPDVIIFTDASKKGWGVICNNVKTNGKCPFRRASYI